MRGFPVLRGPCIDLEGHGELHHGLRRVDHDALCQLHGLLRLRIRAFEDQLVMDLQQHPGGEARLLQRIGHADHGAADDVGGGTLDRRVDGGALEEGALRRVG